MSARLQRRGQPDHADAEDALAAGGHARRRPGGRGAAPHRGAVRLPRRAATRSTPRCGCSVDSYSLLQALCYLAGRLVEDYEVRAGAAAPGAGPAPRAQLDLVWSGAGDEHRDRDRPGRPSRCRSAPRRIALTVRDVVERHGGAFWFERERVRHEAVLPLPAAAGRRAARALDARRVRARREPARVLRLRPVPASRAGAASWPTAAWPS